MPGIASPPASLHDFPALKSLTLSLPPVEPGRVQLLDELRGLSILLILTYHIGGVTGYPNTVHGELGVDVFLLLSGLSLGFAHRPGEPARTFLGRRFLRLLPAYWIALTAFWIGGTQLLGRVNDWRDVVSHYLCAHALWGDKFFFGFNDSFWFLALIVPLYLIYSVLRRWFDRLDIILGVGLILSFFAAWATFSAGQPSTFVHLGLRPSIFFAGIVLGTAFRNGSAQIPLTPWLGLGVLAIFYGMFVTGILVGYTICGFSVFVAYWAMRANADDAGRRWLCRGLAWIGTFSYEIFLIHQPLIRDYNWYVWQRFEIYNPEPWQIAVGVLAGLALTTLIAWPLNRGLNWATRRLRAG